MNEANRNSVQQSPTRPPSSRLFIGNVDYNVSDSDLKHELINLGITPEEVHVALDRETNKGRGFAFANFSTVEQATVAMNMLQGYRMFNRVLRTDYAEERTQKRPSRPRQVETSRGGDYGSAWRDDMEQGQRRRRSRR